MNIRNDLVPKTFDEAVALLVTALEDRDVAQIKAAPNAIRAGTIAHRTVGAFMVHNWKLATGDTPLRRDVMHKFDGLGHPGDVVGLIIECTCHLVRQENWNITQAVQRSKAHWDRLGRNHDGSAKTGT